MNKLSFDIRNSEDFFRKLNEDYKDYKNNPNSARLALNCAMTSWHLSEWIYHEFEMNKSYKKVKLYQAHVKKLCPSLQIMHDISNGSKHYKLDYHKPKVAKTDKHKGTFDNTFDFSFDRTMLQIIMLDGTVLVFDIELEKTILFWADYLKTLND